MSIKYLSTQIKYRNTHQELLILRIYNGDVLYYTTMNTNDYFNTGLKHNACSSGNINILLVIY